MDVNSINLGQILEEIMKIIILVLALLSSLSVFSNEMSEEFMSKAISICVYVNNNGIKTTLLKNYTSLNNACSKKFCELSGKKRITFHAIVAGEDIKHPKDVNWGEFSYTCY